MEALLIDEWVGDVDAITMIDDASVSLARQRAREVAAEQGLTAQDGERLATIASELGQNQVRHAPRGLIAVRAIARGGVNGVEIAAADRGPGISDPARALAGIPRESGSLGVGLAAVRNLAFEVDFDVRLGEGSLVRARVFERDPGSRLQVGVFGRPIASEHTSGDHAAFVQTDDGFAFALSDGLGHGAPAREASALAIRAFRTHSTDPPEQILDENHRALAGTRGGVMASARARGGTLEAAIAGNVAVQIVAPRQERRFGGSSFVLGSRGPYKARAAEAHPFQPGDAIIAFTDGVGSRTSIKEDLPLLREHPIVIAQRLIERHGIDDDALVLVAKFG